MSTRVRRRKSVSSSGQTRDGGVALQDTAAAPRLRLPSVDEIVRSRECAGLVEEHGRSACIAATRKTLDALRQRVRLGQNVDCTAARLAALVASTLAQGAAPRLRRVFNLTGTVIHTNLGRSLLAESAIDAAVRAMRHPASLEFDLGSGTRGERDDVVRELICELTGAEDVAVVNNNAAAVLLVLATLAKDRESIVSRGELIEIGGAFRLPDIMASAGTRLIEIGTTNRTHLKDYENAFRADTAIVMKVHTSNYLIQGFTKEVSTRELAGLLHGKAIPLVDDLGSGTLVDLSAHGLRRERTVQDAISDGADLVTFSGDKLLGGPQAGFIAGRRDLVRRCAKHPMKRALRLDKVRLAALEATLKLYREPDRLTTTLPTLRLLTRPASEINTQAMRLRPNVAAAVGEAFEVRIVEVSSQIGSGALPLETLASFGLAISPKGRASGGLVEVLSRRFRALPIPIAGRIADGALIFDLRCLEDEAEFALTLAKLACNDVDEAGSPE